MIRAPLGDHAYWGEWVVYADEYIDKAWKTASLPAGDPAYEPQYLFVLAQKHWHQMLRRYSAGLPINELAGYFPGLLDAWERSQVLGAEQWTKEQRHTRSAWRLNYDHYIVCFWLIGLALALAIPDEQWQRLLKLVGNEGEDNLLDRIIATRSPQRLIGDQLLYPKPYGRLQIAINAPARQQAELLREFVGHWYFEVGSGSSSGNAQQAAPYKYPYWYKYGDENFAGGAYFGRWCVEAVAAVKAFGLDDGLCLGHEHYPQALLHAERHALEVPIENAKKRGFWRRLLG